MKLSTLCYIRKNGKTLMLHRVKKKNDTHEGKWNGIGGKFEAGETPEECVTREVREETGLEITNPRLFGRLVFPDFGLQPEDWHVYVFEATQFSGELIDSPEGNLEWIPDEKIIDLNLWDGDKLFFEWMKSGKFFSGKIKFNKDMKVAEYKVHFYQF